MGRRFGGGGGGLAASSGIVTSGDADEIVAADGSGGVRSYDNVKIGAGFLSLGATVASAGDIRGRAGFIIQYSVGGVNRPLIEGSAGAEVILGDASNTGGVINRTQATGIIYNQIGGNNRFTINSSGMQIWSSTFDLGGGADVIGIKNATTVPTTNPTGGGILYSEAGAGKWRGSSGTVTTFGAAEPHCPKCGGDFIFEAQNEKYGHLALCFPCLLTALDAAGVDTSAAFIRKAG